MVCSLNEDLHLVFFSLLLSQLEKPTVDVWYLCWKNKFILAGFHISSSSLHFPPPLPTLPLPVFTFPLPYLHFQFQSSLPPPLPTPPVPVFTYPLPFLHFHCQSSLPISLSYAARM
uniref:Uncharacterized protein n=1 Tax=Cacopsylla melanoneura TaxID=428564 RepID=A0A8D9BCL8_9HEMI